MTLPFFASGAQAQIDGHGPDAWRVIDVGVNDVLNARMGPGTNYPVIETFAHDERGLQQITCVPFYTMAHFSVMTEAELDALPPRWCLMRSADMSKAGWVAQRYLIADFDDEVFSGMAERMTNLRRWWMSKRSFPPPRPVLTRGPVTN